MEIIMSELLTGLCPNCNSKLTYRSGERTVMCYACDSSVEVSELSGSTQGSGAAVSAVVAFGGFDNPESGIVFLENFFETYDWDSYQHSSDLQIPEIAEVIGNNKVKNGAVAETWYLDFMGLYVPVSKKFDALTLFENEICDKFNPQDPTEIFAAFDYYRAIATTLLAEKENIFKSIRSAVKFAERFGLASDRLDEMKTALTKLDRQFDSIATKNVVRAKDGASFNVVVDKIELLPAYVAARNEYSLKKKAEYSERGIDAESVYQRAVSEFELGNKSAAVSLFESIREYSDCAIYIKKLNQYFNFHDQMYRFGGKHFIYKEEDYTAEALNVKKLTKRTAQKMEASGQGPVSALSLYEVVNGVPAENPTVKGIDQVITCYGSEFYYFKNGKGIACYDLRTGNETIIDTGKSEQYSDDDGNFFKVELANHAPIFAVKKKYMKVEPTGCFGTVKSSSPVENELNPYTIVLVDMASHTTKVAVGEMVDIKMRKDDKIFYTYAYKKETVSRGCVRGCFGKEEEEKPKTSLMVCDIDNGNISKILDEDCEIHAVKDDLIIYTLWKPNDLNEDLHVYNMTNGCDTVIEKNIYEFFGIIDGRIYYTIGNKEFRPLVRNSFNGLEREQVMLNVERIEAVRAGWFYVRKGKGYNTALVKVRADGKERFPICTAVKKVHRFDGNYVYYEDQFDCMRVVRIDGKENRVLARKVTKVFPTFDGLYYCRKEAVGDREDALSLYKMDKNGLNIKKIVFNVDKVQNDDTAGAMYFSKEEEVRFKVYKNGDEKNAHYEFFNLTRFYSFKKATAEEEATDPELILTLGLPEKESATGCFSSSKNDTVYVEDPIVHSYKNRGLSDAEIMAEEEEETPETDLPAWVPDSVRGCFRSGKGGCLKGCAPGKKKAQNKAKKGVIGERLYTLFSVLFAYFGVLFFSFAISGKGIEPAAMIILIVASLVLGCAGFGILPIFKRRPRSKVGPIIYFLTALILIISIVIGSGFFDTLFAPKGSSRAKAINVTADSQVEDTYSGVKDTGSVWFKFTPTSEGYYTFENDATAYSVYVNVYSGADSHSTYHSASGAKTACYLYSGTTYYIEINQGSFDADDHFWFKAYSTKTGSSLNDAVVMVDGTAEGIYHHVDSAYDEVWFSYTPYNTTYYKFSLSNCSAETKMDLLDSYANVLATGSDSVSYELNSGSTYYVKVTFSISSSYWSNYDNDFEVNAESVYVGSEAGVGIDLSSNYGVSGYYNSLEQYDYIWFKFIPDESATYYFSSNNQAYASLYIYSASDLNNSIGSGTDSASASLESGYTYYIRLSDTNYNLSSYVDMSVQKAAYGESIDIAVEITDTVTTGSYPFVSSSGDSVWFKFDPDYDAYYSFFADTECQNSIAVYCEDESWYIERNTDGSYGLDNGYTYYIKVTMNGGYSSEFDFYAGFSGSVANLAYTVSNNYLNTTYYSIQYAQDSAWFTFTPVYSDSYKLYLNNCLDVDYIEVYDSIDATEPIYVGHNNSAVCPNMISSETYYVKVTAESTYYSYADNTFEFCAEYGFTAGSLKDYAIDIGNGVYSGRYPSIDSSKDSVWFKFVPAENGEHFFTNDAYYYSYPPTMKLYEGDSSTPVAIENGGSYYLYTGSIYYVQVTMGSSTYDYDTEFEIAIKVPARSSLLSAENMDPGNMYLTSLEDVNDEEYFKFTPSSSGSYRFYTENSDGVYAYIYDSNGSQLRYDYSSYGGVSFVLDLTEGETYYMKVSMYSSSSTGIFSVVVNYN